MNRKQRRANKKKKSKQTVQVPEGMDITRTEGGRTKISMAVAGSAINSIEDREDYLEDFEKARLLVEEDNLAEATQILTKLLKMNPNDYGVYELLAISSEKLKNYDAAIQFLEAAKELRPENYPLDVTIANLLVRIDKIEEGMQMAQTCLDNHIDDLNDNHIAAANATIGNAYMLLGDKEKAHGYLQKAAKYGDEDLEHLYNFVTQTGKPKSEDDEFFKKLQALAERNDKERDPRQNALLYYALFDCYDSVKEYETAFDHAMVGAKHKRETIQRNPDKLLNIIDAVRDYFDADFFENHKVEGFNSDKPIFICGMPRSGTTLLEQILQSHPDIAGIGEDALLGHLIRNYSYMEPHGDKLFPLRYTTEIKGHLEPISIGKKYIDYLDKITPDAKKVINKAIGNKLWLGFLSLCLPDAKFIHIKRNAMDGCLSTFTKNFIDSAQSYSYDLEELGTYYRYYVELMEHWNSVLPDKILNIEYEQIVDDLEGKAREIIDFIDLPWDDACLEFHKTESVVRTASVSQVREPIYRRSLNRWKRYGPKIAPLIEALGHAAPEEAKEYLKTLS